MQLQDTPVECALEALLVGVLPLLVDDPEREIFVRWTDAEVQDARIVVSRLLLNSVRGRFRDVDQVGAEDGKTVGLYHFWRRVVDAAGYKAIDSADAPQQPAVRGPLTRNASGCICSSRIR